MFFHIGKTTQSNFPHNHQSKDFIISLDEGWTHFQDHLGNDVWYKGYLDDDILSRFAVNISSETIPSCSGNFCVIKITDQGVVLRSDRSRSWPLWYDPSLGLTNLHDIGETIWVDCLVTLNQDLTLTRSYYDAIGPISNITNSFETVVNEIDHILDKKILNFLSIIDKPLRVFLSGGIDTALIFSYIKKHTSNYELILASHLDYDYFYLKNHSYLETLWGYTQIHHWLDDCYLASGSPGDEYTARSPITANILLRSHGTSIPELLQDPKYVDCLHYSYFMQDKYLKMWDNQTGDPVRPLDEAVRICCNYNINDWQHWHLGRTLTWTPLRELDVFKLVASLGLDDLKDQVMNSVLQIELIKRNDPKILTYLSEQKNSLNHMANLANLL